jgi:sporulation protein YlmC with PRC-barrel domain
MSDGIAQNNVEVALTYLYTVEDLPAFSEVEEFRWKVMLGIDGERIGTIENVERNEDTDRVEFLQVGRGGFLGFGAERFLVPVTVIVRVDEKHVCIDRSLRDLDGVPDYDFERVADPDYCEQIRSWWCAPISSQAK